MNLANKITIVRIGLIPLFMAAFSQYPVGSIENLGFVNHLEQYGVYWAVAIFILAAATDKLDGYIARKYNQVTNLGKLLDPLADKLLVTCALILMVQHQMIPSWIAVVIIGREVMVSYIRILAAAKGVALAADKHGKIKLVLQVVAIVAVLLGNFPFTLITSFPVDFTIMIAAVVMTVYSGYKYVKNNHRALQLEI
ncbi:CDP-diacylglycerol--glycerol-3-phosphate 3-phosphatidyltransferase [Paenibacillus radicis (ex Gao et al. 2016)]|uniref:CDP-diacylglycerol--glycerol-3-phosphate 3-phosphatidyltransferase n=1 Tax=Paenibacillus radicis (ex Gao et al. 2016) TaxID=1737354 RepID=A0A917M1B1_9BACL|nr:CDP-diacylglycerol--glycerol-3-phosphate 3-phosphatidyltransferase [Paenibacillus radicis (ex Gao et al. 2016)]GGG71445.1 CDP-diacylglycerol--glycerol-3-phosphate 3-phosphatidyltransferase [Paenibacillus radicis (ex Gao et al. 2016)]